VAIDIKRPMIDEGEPWLISYADVVTLLLCFFVTLLSATSIDKSRLESLAEMFGDDTVQKTMSLPELKKQVQNLVVSSDLKDMVEVKLTERGVEIQVKEKLLFGAGKADLNVEAQKVLAKLAGMLNSQAVKERRVIIEGHTDSIPIHTAQFNSNWELSSARACEVIRFFIMGGMEANRLQAVGYSDTKPLEPNLPKIGSTKNRRVVLVVS